LFATTVLEEAAEQMRTSTLPFAAGHLARLGYLGTLDRFIAGCRAAAEEGEPLRFDGGLTERELAEHDQAEEAAS
jgi:hypothetical protein